MMETIGDYENWRDKLCHTAEDSISLEMMDEGIVGYLALVKALADTDK